MNWDTALSGLWAAANSPLGLLVVGSVVAWLLTKLFTAKPAWQAWAGTIVAAVKAAEKAIPDDSPNTAIARLNNALQYFAVVYERANGGQAPPKDLLASIEQGIQIMHADLESGGNIPGRDVQQIGVVPSPPPTPETATAGEPAEAVLREGGTLPGARSIPALLLCVALSAVAVFGVGGCMWLPSDSVKGAQHKIALYDPNSGLLTAEYTESGTSNALTRFTMSNYRKTGQRIGIGAAASEDTVADQQGQTAIAQQNAYLQGATTAMQLVGAIMGKSFTPNPPATASWQANTNPGVPALPAPAPQAADVAAMLAACETAEEQATVLKVLGLTPKPKAKAAAPRKPAATQPASRPAGS
jgi:hypothetical protein